MPVGTKATIKGLFLDMLQDPNYIARFAREKYLYSKNGEIIIRIVD